MRILIDGYNLLHASGIFADSGPRRLTELARARRALLRFLAGALQPASRAQTVVVFDASAAPPGLPRHEVCFGLQVQYAAGFPEADALLEELIRRHHTPRQLTVVSSDHRVQRAARRRRASAVDSRSWLESLIAQNRATHAAPQPSKPSLPLSDEEVEYWVRQFSVPDDAQQSPPMPTDDDVSSRDSAPDHASGKRCRRRKQTPEPPADDLNPFAPFTPDHFDDLQF
jgi:predicted RNA-binding protein with PIN domain